MKWTRQQCYALLGLPFSAGEEQIRSTYRQLAKKWHPDLNNSPNAAVEFRRIKQAYEQIQRNDFLEPVQQQITYKEDHQAHSEQERLKKEKRKKAREEYLRRKAEKEKREAEKRNKEFKYFALFTLIFVFVNLSINKVGSMYTRWDILKSPDTTFCQVTYLSYRSCNYRYQVNGKYFIGEVRTRKVGSRMIADNGMPLIEGQQFGLVYKTTDPSKHFVEYSQYSTGTFEHYLLVSKEASKRYFAIEDSSIVVDPDCFVKKLYRDKGLEGWADLYFGHTSWMDNIYNNSRSFDKWKESPDGIEAIEKCTSL